MKPFVKWAGGKRWLIDHPRFVIPKFSGKYIEPFLGGGAMFFHIRPKLALLSDVNPRLIEAYRTIASDPDGVQEQLRKHQKNHSKEYYYEERARKRRLPLSRAGQFLYLNRTCWNGLYRENLNGRFNVPIGTKSDVYDPAEDFNVFASVLKVAEILCQDFEMTLSAASEGDLVFIDPPYTTAHNTNGFVKYNQRIFKWSDQIRLRNSALAARARGAEVLITNADHSSIEDLYNGIGRITRLERSSVISGGANGRGKTTELLIQL